jgi:putative ABC transport system permease protein
MTPIVRSIIWIASRAVPDDWRDSIAGDLAEERRRHPAGVGRDLAFAAAAALIVLRLALTRLHWPRLNGATFRSRAIDLTQAIRQLRRHRGYVVTTVIILALGLGVNAAAFAVAWQFLLKPLPWPGGERLVQIWNVARRTGGVNVLAPANYLDFAQQSRTIETMAAYTFFDYPLNLTGTGEPVEVRIRAVTGDYFDVFGTEPRLGRTLNRADEAAGARTIVISEGLWRRQFGAAPDVIGRRIPLDDRLHEIVGVMPASFDPSARPLDGWVPYAFSPVQRDTRLGFFLGAVGRLRAGARVEEAAAEIATIADRASTLYPASNSNIGGTVHALREEVAGSVRTAMILLAASAALVLLIACANLAGVQLGRVESLRRELAVRSALGASRGRLFAALLMEGIVLSTLAGGVGLWLGLSGVEAVAALAPPSLAQNTNVSLDAAIAAYIFALSVIAGAIFSIVPAYTATRTAGVDILRSRTRSDRRSGALRGSLVVVEVALATTLLIGAAVLVLSLGRVLQIDPGFDARGVVAADLRLPRSRYPTLSHQNTFFDDLGTRLGAVPGVSSVCATNALPLESQGTMTYVPDGTKTMIASRPLTVTVACFETLGIALRRGRIFDRVEAAPVAVVSESYARRAWPGQDALGRTIRLGLPDGAPLTVVGVVEDTRQSSLESISYAEVYRSAQQDTFFVPSKIVLRTDGNPSAIVAALKQTVRDLDAGQPVENVRWLEQVVGRSTAPRRFI